MEYLVTAAAGLTAKHFTAEYWQQQQALVGTSGGRNQVWFVAANTNVANLSEQAVEQWVLRHYYRGGLPGKFIQRSFINTGLARTRALVEFNLLQELHQRGLPVPRVVGAYIKTSCYRYQASLLIERIQGSQDLGRWLLHQELSEQQWALVGACLKKFHRAGLHHVDLNCKNILWQAETEQVYLIDFDRCSLTGNKRTHQASMQRLLRSFKKEQRLAAEQHPLQSFYWQAEQWQQLMIGYEQG